MSSQLTIINYYRVLRSVAVAVFNALSTTIIIYCKGEIEFIQSIQPETK